MSERVKLEVIVDRELCVATVDDATVSETLASETLAGAWFTDEELARLTPAGYTSDAFTIRTDAGAAPPHWTGPLPPPMDEWYPWTSQ